MALPRSRSNAIELPWPRTSLFVSSGSSTMRTLAVVLFTSLGELLATSLMSPPGYFLRVALLPSLRLFRRMRSASAGVARTMGLNFSASKSFADFSRGNITTCTQGFQCA